MKTFHKAVDIFEKNLNQALDPQNKVVNQHKFFEKLTPWGTWGSAGSDNNDDFSRIVLFKQQLYKNLNIKKILTTEELITFAINFPAKGRLLSFYILKSIREAVGFTDIHSDYLIPKYQQANSWEERIQGGHFEFYETVYPTKQDSKIAIENLIVLAVLGIYKRELLVYLSDNLGLKSPNYPDYGQTLLKHLDKKIVETRETNFQKHKNNLYKKIDKMRKYGETFLNLDSEKRDVVIKLSEALQKKADNFFKEKPDFNTTQIFLSEFKSLLHSEKMNEHRKIWKPIVANLLIALTGVGAIALAHRVISSTVENNEFSFNSAFFFAKTNRQKKIEKIDKSIDLAVQAYRNYVSVC